MKTILTKSTVILLAIGLAALYILGLSVPADELSPFSTYNVNYIPVYLFYLACFVVSGFAAAWLFSGGQNDSAGQPYRWCRLIPYGAVILFLALYYHFKGTALSVWDGWWHVEKLYAFALPLVFWCIAEGLYRSKLPCCRFGVLLRPLYFLIVSGLTAVSVCWYSYNNIFNYDSIRLAMLIVSAVLALWIVEGKPFHIWFFRTPVRKFYESPFLCAAAMTFGFFSTSERFTDILSTWNKPAEPYISMPGVYDILEYHNWFAYRWTVLLENLQGCLNSVYKLNANLIPRWNSLVWLNYVYGFLPVAAAMLLLVGVFVLLWKCAKNSDRLSKFLYTVLLLRTVLGLIANLLVVYSTEITPLMMGLMPWDVIFVIMILWRRTKKNEPKQ